jgi:hypothetical protein
MPAFLAMSVTLLAKSVIPATGIAIAVAAAKIAAKRFFNLVLFRSGSGF